MINPRLWIFLLLTFSYGVTRSQIIYNSCNSFSISSGAVFQVNGGFSNTAAGIVSNNGETTIQGNFTNYGSFSSGGEMNISGDFENYNTFTPLTGAVTLNGGNQAIKGLTDIPFYNLSLAGTGKKTLQQHIRISGQLVLADLELAAESFTATVLNPSVSAVTRTTGFVSTLQNGKLYRYTSSQGAYLFPLGSSVGTARYRPVEITPVSAGGYQYYAAFRNVNPSADGYPVTSNDGSFCNLNNQFYHIAGGSAGTEFSDITFYFDNISDGNFENLAKWNLTLWQNVSPVIYTAGTPLSYVRYDNWNTQTQNRFTLANPIQSLSMADDTSFCSGTSVSISAGAGYDSYLWSTGATAAGITVTSPGTYRVTVTDGPCIITDSIQVQQIQSPIANAGNDTSICEDESVTLTASGGGTYLWSNGSSLPALTLTPAGTQTVYLTVTGNTCNDTDSVTITVTLPPVVSAGNDTTIYEGQSLTLVPSFNGNIVSYSWSPSTYLSNAFIPSPVTTPPISLTYTIIVTDAGGCTSNDSLTVFVVEDPNADIIIYNTFTPNNDGTNDTWYIENIEHFQDNYLQIFNRNGHLVYEKENYQNEWDGKYYGNDLPAATYYFVLDLKDGRIIKGDITIIR